MKAYMSDGFQLIQDIIKLRWVPEILGAIAEGKGNYSEIADAIEGLSHTELNRKLSVLLDKNALVRKGDSARDGYELTVFGKDLDHIFNHFVEMGERYSK